MQAENDSVPLTQDQVASASKELALVMFRHGMNLEKLSEFITENSDQIASEYAKKLRHRDYLDHRKVVRREVLRCHWIGIPYREICETLDVSMSRAPEIKALEMDRIWKKYREDPSSACTLAAEYGLTENDIVAIFENRQDRWEQQEEREQRLQAERDEEFDELIRAK